MLLFPPTLATTAHIAGGNDVQRGEHLTTELNGGIFLADGQGAGEERIREGAVPSATINEAEGGEGQQQQQQQQFLLHSQLQHQLMVMELQHLNAKHHQQQQFSQLDHPLNGITVGTNLPINAIGASDMFNPSSLLPSPHHHHSLFVPPPSTACSNGMLFPPPPPQPNCTFPSFGNVENHQLLTTQFVPSPQHQPSQSDNTTAAPPPSSITFSAFPTPSTAASNSLAFGVPNGDGGGGGHGQSPAAAAMAMSPTSPCGLCRLPILDKCFLFADAQSWHLNCLRCAVCGQELERLGATCFARDGLLFCRRDYLMKFGKRCQRCGLPIERGELVMRVPRPQPADGDDAAAAEGMAERQRRATATTPLHFHMHCFTCICCGQQLQAGEQYMVGGSCPSSGGAGDAGGGVGPLFCRAHFHLNPSVMVAAAAALQHQQQQQLPAPTPMFPAQTGLLFPVVPTLPSSSHQRLLNDEIQQQPNNNGNAGNEQSHFLVELNSNGNNNGGGSQTTKTDPQIRAAQQQQSPAFPSTINAVVNGCVVPPPPNAVLPSAASFKDFLMTGMPINEQQPQQMETMGMLMMGTEGSGINGGNENLAPIDQQHLLHHHHQQQQQQYAQQQRVLSSSASVTPTGGPLSSEGIGTAAGAYDCNVISYPNSNGGVDNDGNNSDSNTGGDGGDGYCCSVGGGGTSQKQKRLRTSFKHQQLRTMKAYFGINHNPDAKDLKQLAQKTGLTKRVLQVWFQNARAKYRRSQQHKMGGAFIGGSAIAIGIPAAAASQPPSASSASLLLDSQQQPTLAHLLLTTNNNNNNVNGAYQPNGEANGGAVANTDCMQQTLTTTTMDNATTPLDCPPSSHQHQQQFAPLSLVQHPHHHHQLPPLMVLAPTGYAAGPFPALGSATVTTTAIACHSSGGSNNNNNCNSNNDHPGTTPSLSPIQQMLDAGAVIDGAAGNCNDDEQMMVMMMNGNGCRGNGNGAENDNDDGSNHIQ